MIPILARFVEKYFEKTPKFDMTSLLRGTDAVFSSLIHSFNWNLATFLHAYTCLPLAYTTSQTVVQFCKMLLIKCFLICSNQPWLPGYVLIESSFPFFVLCK
ncbi:hypothetical protein LXL04_021775 [Taraxacum kok-saghyz]